MVEQIKGRVYPPNIEKEYTIPTCDVSDLCKWLLNYFREKKKIEFKSEWGITKILDVTQKVADDGIVIHVESIYNEFIGPLENKNEYLPIVIKLDFIKIKIIKTKEGAKLNLWARAEFDINTFENQLQEDWGSFPECRILDEGNPSVKLTSNGSQRRTISKRKINKPRRDAAEKIGFVMYLVEKGEFRNPSAACKRFHIRYDTFDNYRDFPLTIEYKDGFKKDPSSADRYRQELAQRSKKGIRLVT